MTKIVAFAGSSRSGSYNKKLVAISAKAAESAGAEVSLLDLRDFPMPIFDEDYESEHGMPEYAGKFKQALVQSDGMLISSPEYNSGYSALLKNSLDWASRSESKDEPLLYAFSGKVAGLMSASPGPLGGLRGLVVLRMLLGNLGVSLLPRQITVPSAMDIFDDDGQLTDERRHKNVTRLGIELVELLGKLKHPE